MPTLFKVCGCYLIVSARKSPLKSKRWIINDLHRRGINLRCAFHGMLVMIFEPGSRLQWRQIVHNTLSRAYTLVKHDSFFGPREYLYLSAQERRLLYFNKHRCDWYRSHAIASVQLLIVPQWEILFRQLAPLARVLCLQRRRRRSSYLAIRRPEREIEERQIQSQGFKGT